MAYSSFPHQRVPHLTSPLPISNVTPCHWLNPSNHLIHYTSLSCRISPVCWSHGQVSLDFPTHLTNIVFQECSSYSSHIANRGCRVKISCIYTQIVFLLMYPHPVAYPTLFSNTYLVVSGSVSQIICSGYLLTPACLDCCSHCEPMECPCKD